MFDIVYSNNCDITSKTSNTYIIDKLLRMKVRLKKMKENEQLCEFMQFCSFRIPLNKVFGEIFAVIEYGNAPTSLIFLLKVMHTKFKRSNAIL